MQIKDLSHDCSNGKKNKASLQVDMYNNALRTSKCHIKGQCMKYIYVFETPACTKL